MYARADTCVIDEGMDEKTPPEAVQKVKDENVKVMNRIMGKVVQLSGGVKTGDMRQMLEDLVRES